MGHLECLPLLNKTYENLGDVLKIIEAAATKNWFVLCLNSVCFEILFKNICSTETTPCSWRYWTLMTIRWPDKCLLKQTVLRWADPNISSYVYEDQIYSLPFAKFYTFTTFLIYFTFALRASYTALHSSLNPPITLLHIMGDSNPGKKTIVYCYWNNLQDISRKWDLFYYLYCLSHALLLDSQSFYGGSER